MLSAIQRLGISGGIGFIIGLVIVLYVKPTESGGVAILILIPIIICMTIGGITSALRSKGNTSAVQKKVAKESADE